MQLQLLDQRHNLKILKYNLVFLERRLLDQRHKLKIKQSYHLTKRQVLVLLQLYQIVEQQFLGSKLQFLQIKLRVQVQVLLQLQGQKHKLKIKKYYPLLQQLYQVIRPQALGQVLHYPRLLQRYQMRKHKVLDQVLQYQTNKL